MNSRVAFYRPIENAFLGFENLFEQMDRQLAVTQVDNFPPHNIFRDSDGGYTIEMALAGYKKDDVEVTHDTKDNTLRIWAQATSPDPDPKTALRIGIARRQIRRSFTISDQLRVESAIMQDGLLTIKLKPIEKPDGTLLKIAVS